MGTKQGAQMSGEEYLKGRRAGVEGTEGQSRKGIAEKTIPDSNMHDADSGSRQKDLSSAAGSMYSKAVRNSGDSIGDKALMER